MAKWYGKIGYSETAETAPGVWTSQETVREYYGDVIRNTTRWSGNPESTNNNLTVNSQISIVADPFAINKFYSMKWIEFMGTRWKIDSVDPQFPRLLLTLGGVYNGE
jgi:hypothetical protein